MPVHPSAVVDPSVRIPESCTIGPFCFVGAGVEMGEHCELVSHVVLTGPTKMGSHNRIQPFAAVGMGPQDLSFKNEPTRLEMGDHNEIREYVTIHRGTVKGGGLTKIGSNCLLMAYAHIAHDCFIGDHVIMANAATLAGHVYVEDWAVVGALCPVHQYVTVGTHSYVGGGTTITQDVMPFSKTCAVRDVHAYGANSIGLERRGFSKERVRAIQRAFRTLLAAKLNTTQALERIESAGAMTEDVKLLVEFIRKSERGVLK
ncbi:MAG: acyl-[acyl-carrier-protein]--UDP-N-acetylglucosamine O-acyltransferase [Acidobacteria bacterium]|nr:MAG: acyl-[acyl-carrier-protein]--UDP-N-acetylglucosamine O-acyltransferase [Acidobacteriota bacterium]